MTVGELSRRRFLGTTTATIGAIGLPSLLATEAEAAGRVWRGAKSANGWPVLDQARTFRVEGSSQSVALAGGDVATVLLHVARRFNYEIDTLREGDLAGFSTNPKIAQPYESNYLSGTAIALRPAGYPAGASGLFFPLELTVIRDILAELDGAVSWGGDEKVAKESHFQIAVPPVGLTVAARRISGWNEGHGGQGAGAIDAFAAGRVRSAQAFERRTR